MLKNVVLKYIFFYLGQLELVFFPSALGAASFVRCHHHRHRHPHGRLAMVVPKINLTRA